MPQQLSTKSTKQPSHLNDNSQLNCSLCLSVKVSGSGPHAVMLSLDEPLDLKVPRGRVGGRDRGAMSPPTLTPSPIHAKGAGQLRMADDGTAVIIPASPASPHTGKQERFSITSNITAGSVTEVCVCRCPAGQVRDPHTARCGPQHVPVLPQHRLLSGSLQRKRLSSHFPRGKSTTLGKSTTWVLRRTFKSKYTSTIYVSKKLASFTQK